MHFLKQKKDLVILTAVLLVIIIVGILWQIQLDLKSELRLVEGDLHYVNIYSPFQLCVRGSSSGGDVLKLNGVSISEEVIILDEPTLTLEALKRGQVNLEFSFFGLIPFRKVTVNVVPEINVIPGGHSIGIKLHSEGVIVSGYYYIEQDGRSYSPGEEAGIKVGETLVAIEGEKVKDINAVSELVNLWGEKKGSIVVTVLRGGKEYNIEVEPLFNPEDGYRLGLYVRDTAAGVGTLTFYEPQTKRFGALGHIITDLDSNKPVEIYDGEVVRANIIDVKTAQRGQPGEKRGIFVDSEDVIGTIDKNTPFGIFGSIYELDLSQSPYSEPLPVALASQVEVGPAKVLTVIDGHKIESFEVYIERLFPQTTPQDRSLIIRVTDDRLLQATGGIVQGMSGSPILQNGRLVGAVTHVFVNDPGRGYGIFMEWMLHEAGIYEERVIENIKLEEQQKAA